MGGGDWKERRDEPKGQFSRRRLIVDRRSVDTRNLWGVKLIGMNSYAAQIMSLGSAFD